MTTQIVSRPQSPAGKCSFIAFYAFMMIFISGCDASAKDKGATPAASAAVQATPVPGTISRLAIVALELCTTIL